MSTETFLDGKVGLCCGDSIHFMRDQPNNRYDSIVTDPPYALISTTKRFANSPRSEAAMPTSGPHARASRGFMGKEWDTGDAAHDAGFWAECLRVLKPGGHLVAFGGSRTYHRLACAIEDAGFEIRDQLQWLYGQGFPKNKSLLKPGHEPICMARKPLAGTVEANLLRWGTGTINIDGCRIGNFDHDAYVADLIDEATRNGEASAGRRYTESGSTSFAATPGPRGGSVKGRWPANVITDGSDEVVAMFPSALGQIARSRDDGGPTGNAIYGAFNYGGPVHIPRLEDNKNAARFFYQAKATKKDRAGSKHPTVKPVALMRYLCRLVTPPGGLVLDPFAGTGTTAEAAFHEGMRCMLVEREIDYQGDIRRRMAMLVRHAASSAVKKRPFKIVRTQADLFGEEPCR